VTPGGVRAEILRFVAQTTARPLDPASISDDTNLVERGFLDSLGFVGLIAHLEERYQVELDLVGTPIEEFVVLGPLVRQVQGG
jgi:acyl carrier protein